MALAVLMVLAAAARLFSEFHTCGFVGWDTYPLIANNQIASWSDLMDVLSKSLMGQSEGGIYYRPLVNLSIALDQSLWGLGPTGYHITSTAAFAAAALAVYRLGTRLFLGVSRAAPLVLLAFFLLHPVHATVIPVAARRGDSFCLAFMALALASVATQASMTPRRFVFAATLATLALLSKEVAFLLPPLAATVAFLYAPEGVPLGRRFTRSLVAAAPMAVGLALVAPARIFVLGGLIGTRPFASVLDSSALLSMLGRVGAGVLGGSEIIAGATVPWGLCLALASVSVTAFALAPTEHRKAAASISWRPALFGALWFLALGATFAFGLILQPWYLLGSVAAYALLAAALVSGMWRIIKGGGVPAAASWVALLGTAGLLLSLGLHSPLLHSYDSWQEATDLQNDYLGSIQRDVDAAKNGDVVTAPKPPYLLKPNPQSGGLHGVAMLSGYSVVAWSKLTFPERNVTIAYGRRGDGQPRPDRVVVVLGKLIEEDGA